MTLVEIPERAVAPGGHFPRNRQVLGERRQCRHRLCPVSRRRSGESFDLFSPEQDGGGHEGEQRDEEPSERRHRSPVAEVQCVAEAEAKKAA
jgi:hypothetical protein